MDISYLRQQIETAYGFDNLDVTVMGGDDLRNVYQITHGNKKYILRLFPTKRSEETIKADVAILQFLESKKFPAPQIISTQKGETIVHIDNRNSILTTYIDGDIVLNTPDSLFHMGVLMAKLHSLDFNSYLYDSSWSVEKERKTIEAHISTFDSSKAEDAAIIAETLQALSEVPLFSELPKSIIHSDIHRKNTIKTPSGEYYFIDWDDAGVGTTILDLAEVLSQVCIRFQNEELYDMAFLNHDLAKAFMKGYYSIRNLSAKEKDLMVEAMKFTALAYVIQYWNSSISLGDWRRYQLEKEEGLKLIEGIV